MPYARPAKTEPKSSTDRFHPNEHVGRLLLLVPRNYEEGVRTRFGVKDTVEADITVLDGPQAGAEYARAFVYNTVLIDQLRSLVGEQVLGRLALEEGGQGSYYQLDDPTIQDEITASRVATGLAA